LTADLASGLPERSGVDRSCRWRVIVVDDHDPSRAALRAAVEAAGGRVVGEAGRRAEALPLVEHLRPHVAVVAVGLPDGNGVDVAPALTAAGCPVVLFTGRRDDALVARAAEAGVMGWLGKPLRAEDVPPTLDLAVARFAEVRTLRSRLEERKVIERAKGLLMRRYNLDEIEAFRRLRRAAMDSRRPMVEVARAVLRSEAPPPPLATR
jgi:response regulator NasT